MEQIIKTLLITRKESLVDPLANGVRSGEFIRAVLTQIICGKFAHLIASLAGGWLPLSQLNGKE
jgi:hypothetical protein